MAPIGKPIASGERCFSPAQTRAARGLLDWSSARLAAEARLEREAVVLYERGAAELGEQELRRLSATIRRAGVVAVRAALAGEGVRFQRAPSEAIRRGSRTPFATDREELPDWLPLVEDARVRS